MNATENPRRAGCGRQCSVASPGGLLAAIDVLAFVDAGVERIAASRANRESARDRMRGEDVQQERLDAFAVLRAALLAAPRERFGVQAFGDEYASGLVDVGHGVGPWVVDE